MSDDDAKSRNDRPATAGDPPPVALDYSSSDAEPPHLHLSVRDYLNIFAILMGLLVVTVAAAFLPHWGFVNLAIAMTIAIVKATLVVLYFMHVRYSSRLTMIFVVSMTLWIGILFVLTFTDYATRDELPMSRGWNENPVIKAEEAASTEQHGSADASSNAAAHE